jgi:phosphotriesterase-related protein
MTVTGPVPANALGRALTHEHVVVDFVGAAKASPARFDHDEMFRTALPALRALRARGVTALFECTPAYIGRSPALLRRLAVASGLQIITNTGYYGAVGNRYLPPHAHLEDADALAARWLREWHDGVDGTGVRPGFLKLGVDAGPLSPLHERLVRAAARAHRATGLPIAIHTGDGRAATDEVRVLAEESVAPEALVWVHAQNDPGPTQRALAARGVWISLDGHSARRDRSAAYLRMVLALRDAGLLSKVLLSHDDGWSLEGPPPCRPVLFGNGNPRPYESLFTTLWPALAAHGFGPAEERTLFIENPARAFAIRVRAPARGGAPPHEPRTPSRAAWSD